jgi:hypothetical protein
MEKNGEEREENQAVSLQAAKAQEPGKFVREISGPYINSEELTIRWMG